MALQRSGSASNASLLSRTRNLISKAARSASREAVGADRSAVEASFEAEVPTQHSGVDIDRRDTRRYHHQLGVGPVDHNHTIVG